MRYTNLPTLLFYFYFTILQADSLPKSEVWQPMALFYFHKMNHVNSHDDCTINVVQMLVLLFLLVSETKE